MAFPQSTTVDVTTAEPALYGILSPAATVIYDDSAHWQSGYTYETLDCGTEVRLSTPCSATGESVLAVEAEDGQPLWRSYIPFNIETAFQCSSLGGRLLDYEAKAYSRMEACQQKAIEREFWTGALAKAEDAANGADPFPNRYLASTDVQDRTPGGGAAVKPKHGLALLEQALGDCGCGVRGTIHVTRGVASSLGLSGSDGSLETPLGNKVIAGSGYTGSGPDGTAPTGTVQWMYATGPVTVRLGPILSRSGSRAETLDTRTNTVLVHADRSAGVTWDSCCHYGVKVDLALDYS